jgi:protein-arginine kinase activator protein McsA
MLAITRTSVASKPDPLVCPECKKNSGFLISDDESMIEIVKAISSGGLHSVPKLISVALKYSFSKRCRCGNCGHTWRVWKY